jgi:hypothetical protein
VVQIQIQNWIRILDCIGYWIQIHPVWIQNWTKIQNTIPQKKVLRTVELEFLQMSLIFTSQTIWIKIVTYFQFTNNLEQNTELNPDFTKIQDPHTDPVYFGNIALE